MNVQLRWRSFHSTMPRHPRAYWSGRPLTTHSAPFLPGVAAGDVGELAFKGRCRGRAVRPLHPGGRRGERGVARLRRAVEDEARARKPCKVAAMVGSKSKSCAQARRLRSVSTPFGVAKDLSLRSPSSLHESVMLRAAQFNATFGVPETTLSA